MYTKEQILAPVESIEIRDGVILRENATTHRTMATLVRASDVFCNIRSVDGFCEQIQQFLNDYNRQNFVTTNSLSVAVRLDDDHFRRFVYDPIPHLFGIEERIDYLALDCSLEAAETLIPLLADKPVGSFIFTTGCGSQMQSVAVYDAEKGTLFIGHMVKAVRSLRMDCDAPAPATESC